MCARMYPCVQYMYIVRTCVCTCVNTWTYKCMAHQLEGSENRKEKTPNHPTQTIHVTCVYIVHVHDTHTMYTAGECSVLWSQDSAAWSPEV